MNSSWQYLAPKFLVSSNKKQINNNNKLELLNTAVQSADLLAALGVSLGGGQMQSTVHLLLVV